MLNALKTKLFQQIKAVFFFFGPLISVESHGALFWVVLSGNADQNNDFVYVDNPDSP